MPLLKLNRINKGGEILINSEHILFVEVEGKSTTVHLADNLLFSVVEPLDVILETVERLEAAQLKKALEK
jgi:hypothetical protein